MISRAVPRLRVLRVAAAAALVTVTASCGAAPAAAPVPAPDRTEAFCDAVVNLDMSARTSAADLASVPDAELPSTVDAYSNTLRSLLPAVQASAPPSLVPAVATLVRLNLDAESRADAGVYRSPDFVTARSDVDTAALASCGFPEIKINAREFALDGVPTDEVVPGTVAVTVTNAGAAPHAEIVARIADAEKRPVSELAKLPYDRLSTLLEPVGAVRVDPGRTATAFLRLTPGRYALLCPVPTAPTPAPTTTRAERATRTPAPAPPGPPSYTKGEFGEFRVGP